MQQPSASLVPVAVSTSIREVEGLPRVRLNAAYVRALESVGLVPVIVPPLSDPLAAVRVLDFVAGLVLTGGEDVDPSLYGQERHPELGATNCARDATELALLGAARERGLPTLAICRGVQLLNVGLGGSLVQDLASQQTDSHDHEVDDKRAARVHAVRVAPESRLSEIVGDRALQVNSVHHQAIDRLGSAMRATAWAADGVIEGVESDDPKWWMVGVQWHPEELIDTAEPWDRRLFAAFAETCRARSTSGSEVSSTSTSLPAAPGASASQASGDSGKSARR